MSQPLHKNRENDSVQEIGEKLVISKFRGQEGIPLMKNAPQIQIKCSLELPVPKVTSFLDEVFSSTPDYFSPALWVWKHVQNPFESSRFWSAWDSDQLIGTRPLWAWRLKLGIEKVVAFQCVDTAVSAAYRGRGVFSGLVRRMLEDIDNVLIFNFPNSNSFPGYMKLGWVALSGLRTFVRPLSFGGLVRSILYRVLKRFRNQSIVPSKVIVLPSSNLLERLQCPEVIDHLRPLLLSYASSLSQKLTTDIDVPYLLWRYSDPTRAPFYSLELWDDGELAALLVYRVADIGGLHVAFLYDALLDFSDQEMVLRVFRRAFVELRRVADEVRCVLSQGHPLYELCSPLGFFPRGTTNFVVNPSRLRYSLPWNDAQNWAICGSVLDGW